MATRGAQTRCFRDHLQPPLSVGLLHAERHCYSRFGTSCFLCNERETLQASPLCGAAVLREPNQAHGPAAKARIMWCGLCRPKGTRLGPNSLRDIESCDGLGALLGLPCTGPTGPLRAPNRHHESPQMRKDRGQTTEPL